MSVGTISHLWSHDCTYMRYLKKSSLQRPVRLLCTVQSGTNAFFAHIETVVLNDTTRWQKKSMYLIEGTCSKILESEYLMRPAHLPSEDRESGSLVTLAHCHVSPPNLYLSGVGWLDEVNHSDILGGKNLHWKLFHERLKWPLGAILYFLLELPASQ